MSTLEPNATLREIEYLLANAANDADRHYELTTLTTNITAWLDRGGYEPDWHRFPVASLLYEGGL